MNIKRAYDVNQLRDYSCLFTRSEVNRWYNNDFSSLRLKVLRYNSSLLADNCTYLSYLKHVYRVLEIFYPNEYIYKNEFINKWLLKEIGVSDSIVFNEFKLGKAVADLVMFNGNSKVFEIKTLLDKETRLNNQLVEYSKLFNEVYLIVPEEKIEKYLQYDSKVGIITYEYKNNAFSLVRRATYNEVLDVDTLMEVLHTNEYISIVENYFGTKPAFTDFNKFKVCKELINQIPTNILNQQFIGLMKARKINNEFSKNENEFNQIFLSLNYSNKQKRKLLSNLRTMIH